MLVRATAVPAIDLLASRCFHKKLDHAQSLLEEHLKKDDPTEVFELVEMIGKGDNSTQTSSMHTQEVTAQSSKDWKRRPELWLP